MLSLEELLSLKKPQEIPIEYNLLSFIYLFFSAMSFFYFFSEYNYLYLIISFFTFGIGYNHYFDSKYINGMYGDSRLSYLTKNFCLEMELLFNHFKKDFYYSSLKFDFRLENKNITILKDSEKIYEYNLEDKSIKNKLNTDFSIPLLTFLNEVEFNYIKQKEV